MALGTSKLTAAWNDTDGTSFTTGSITPTANALVVLMIVAHDAESAPEEPSSITGTNWANGLTWTLQGTSIEVANGDDGGSAQMSIYTTTAPAVPVAGTVTGTFSATHEKYGWFIVEWTDTTTPTVLQIKEDTELPMGPTQAIAFDAAPDAASGVCILAAQAENATIGASPQVGYTDYVRQGDADVPQWTMAGNYKTSAGDQTLVLDTNSQTDNVGGFALEIGQSPDDSSPAVASTGLAGDLGVCLFSGFLGG
jgi:hypothetical protein